MKSKPLTTLSSHVACSKLIMNERNQSNILMPTIWDYVRINIPNQRKHSHRNSDSKPYCYANSYSQSRLLIMFRSEKRRILQSPQSLVVVSMRTCEGPSKYVPPTTVSCAPRRIAFGSKLVISSFFLSCSWVRSGLCAFGLR
jgi:hypothetical protein